MKISFLLRMLAMLAVIGVTMTLHSQVVDVTASLDASAVAVGGSTTLRVFARVVPAQQTNANRIFFWHVDVLNTNGTIASANYNAMQKTDSDKDPSTSSTGVQDEANRRGVYDTFLNLPGAGVSNAVELMAIPVTGLTAGQTRFRIQAGTAEVLSSDFLVAPNGGGPPMTGGNYLLAQAALTVNAGMPTGTVSISVTNAGFGTNGVTLNFPTIAGFNYTVQFRSQLVGGSIWQSLAGGPHNSGRVFEFTTGAARFYRVLVAPAN